MADDGYDDDWNNKGSEQQKNNKGNQNAGNSGGKQEEPRSRLAGRQTEDQADPPANQTPVLSPEPPPDQEPAPVADQPATPPPTPAAPLPLTCKAMAPESQLANAMARLDGLTNWEQRPRATMRVGLEADDRPRRAAWRPAKLLSFDPCRGNQGQGVGLSADRGRAAAEDPAFALLGRYASPHVERLTERVSLEGREVDEASLARAL